MHVTFHSRVRYAKDIILVKGEKLMPGVRDVARAAGVSIATVSRVLNGEENVMPDTRHQVEQAIRTTGYSFNKSEKSRATIELIYNVISHYAGDDYKTRLYMGIIDSALSSGAELHLSQLPFSEWTSANLRALAKKWHIRGFVAVNTAGSLDWYDEVAKSRLPFIVLSSVDPLSRVATVTADQKGGMKLAIQHLAQMGHKRISLLCRDMTSYDSRERYAGFAEAMKSVGLAAENRFIRTNVLTTSDTMRALQEVINVANRDARTEERPTALVAADFSLAFDVMETLSVMGISVPDKVSLVGYGDYQMREFSRPKLTTVVQPVYEMGMMAIRNLMASVRLDSSASVVLPTRLAIGGSTNSAPQAP